jgi:hypothetical protein
MPGIEPGKSVPENIFSSVTYINFYYFINRCYFFSILFFIVNKKNILPVITITLKVEIGRREWMSEHNYGESTPLPQIN